MKIKITFYCYYPVMIDSSHFLETLQRDHNLKDIFGKKYVKETLTCEHLKQETRKKQEF